MGNFLHHIAQSEALTLTIWCNIFHWLLPFIAYSFTLDYALWKIPHLAFRVCGHAFWLICKPLPAIVKSYVLEVDTETATHPASTICTPHWWWAPIKAKQLPVALLSFVGWLGRWSLVALNRTSVPWPLINLWLSVTSWHKMFPVITVIYHSLSLGYAVCKVPHLASMLVNVEIAESTVMWMGVWGQQGISLMCTF